MEILAELAHLIDRHVPGDGVHDSALPRVGLIRSSTPTEPMPVLYEPALCLIAQGSKRATLGDLSFDYDAARYLLVSVDLPVIGHVTVASPERPYLCVTLRLDLVTLSQLVLELGPASPAELPAEKAIGFRLHDSDPALLDAAVRLLRLLDRPAEAPILAPLIEREMLYRLLVGDMGGMLRHIATAQGRLARINLAIAWIRDNFREPMAIEEVARVAGMSPSSFFHHFKAVTNMTPLQYQKQLRLREARRLLLAEAADAASAGFQVGYESASQFSREYRRLFGAPPIRDLARLRMMPELAAQVA